MSLVSLDTVTDDFNSIVHVSTPVTSSGPVEESSHSFDAYGTHRSLEKMRIVASRVWETRAASGSFAECNVDELRTALYLNQRSWHCGAMAIEVDVGIEWELVEAIAVMSIARDD